MDSSEVTAVRWHRWSETQICSTPKPATSLVALKFPAHTLSHVAASPESYFSTPLGAA